MEVKTALTFPEGRKAVCTVCGMAWLELDALRAAPPSADAQARKLSPVCSRSVSCALSALPSAAGEALLRTVLAPRPVDAERPLV